MIEKAVLLACVKTIHSHYYMPPRRKSACSASPVRKTMIGCDQVICGRPAKRVVVTAVLDAGTWMAANNRKSLFLVMSFMKVL
jgi:hypothetical protein